MTDGDLAILHMIMQLNNTLLSIKKFMVEESKKRDALPPVQEEIKVRTQQSNAG